MLGLAAVGCGGGDDDDDDKGGGCSTPKVTGSPFNTGTASAHGSGMLLAGPPDGFELSLLLDDGSTVPDEFFPDGVSRIPTVCGSAFTYEVTKVAAGTYKMAYEIYDPADYTAPKFTATSKNDFTVAEGASVEFNPTF